MSGGWKRSMVEMVGHPQTKGRATGENKPRPKPPRHTSTLPVCYGKAVYRPGMSAKVLAITLQGDGPDLGDVMAQETLREAVRSIAEEEPRNPENLPE